MNPEEGEELGRSPTFSVPGLILLGPSNGQVTCNNEAIRILAYPSPSVNVRRIGGLVAEKLPFTAKLHGSADDVHRVAEFTSGKRRYICSRWCLSVHGSESLRTIAILLERQAAPNVIMHELCEQFHLTTRERQAVAFLVRGLTSKEIAQQMGISPNTVKSFLRLVMTKAGVSTRAGLIGKVAGITLRPTSSVEGMKAMSLTRSREHVPALR
jgi:DNA-binding CsgD family transcriptional regulator